MGKLIMQSAGSPAAKRLIRDGRVVGFVLQLANDRWALYGTKQEPLSPRRSYSSAQRAKTAFALLQEAPQ